MQTLRVAISGFIEHFLTSPSCPKAETVCKMKTTTGLSKAPDELIKENKQFALLTILGAISGVQSVAESLNSQTIRGLQRVRDQELFTVFGFKRFDNFLNESPYAPMNYAKFNRKEGALKNEGDELFDFLNSIDAPLSKRRLLGKGDVQIENKELVARVGAEEIRVPLSNTSRILTVMSRVVEQRNEQARTIERGKKQINSLKDKLAEEKARTRPGSGQSGAPFFDALLSVIGAMSLLATEAEKLVPEERERQRDEVFKTLGEQMVRLDEALGLVVPDTVKRGKGGPVPAELLKAIPDDED